MQVFLKRLNEIKPYDNNPRNNEEAIKTVANSINNFGFKQPIVVDKKGVIVAGHTRYKAAERLGMQEVPCIVADDLTQNQIKAYRIADNKVAEASQWDNALLLKELDELKELDIDLESTGFSILEIEKLKIDDYDYSEYDNSGKFDDPVGVVSYNIIFNDEAEQYEWQKFLRALKEKYPDYETISERIIIAIQEWMHG